MATKKRSTRGGGGSGEKQADGELQSGREVRTGIIQLNSGQKAVQYTIVDGLAIFEGDIVLGTVEQVEQQTETARQGLQEAVVITGAQFRWKNCRIPYTIDPALTNQARVTDAIAHWESKTNFRFVVRTNEADFVTFRPGTGCSSSVGRQGGQQFVNLAAGCLKGQTIHEIGHVVGLWHEQSREDRDTFVRIEWANIQAGTEHNFNQHITDGDDVGLYDYGSIMHYGGTAFSKNGLATIVPINPAGASIGQRNGLSAGDIAAASTLCTGLVVTKKEAILDKTFDTRKELTKDLRLDTRKEQIFDTRKEQVLDKRFDPIDPFGPRKFDQVGPLRGGGTIAGGGAALPFAMATAHQAPSADAPGGGPDTTADQAALQLDAQLAQLAEGLAQAQSNVDALQQQYDETLALLKQLVDQQGK